MQLKIRRLKVFKRRNENGHKHDKATKENIMT